MFSLRLPVGAGGDFLACLLSGVAQVHAALLPLLLDFKNSMLASTCASIISTAAFVWFFFVYSERLVWLAISLLGAGWLREAPGFALFVRARLRSESRSRANGSAVYAATELVCVLSEEREQQSLLPELRDSIRLPPGPENRVYKRKIKHTQTFAQIWEVSEIRFCRSEENLNLNLNVGCA